MKRLLYEQKITGTSPIWISASVVAVFVLIAIFGGDLLNLSCFGFEVVFPFFVTIAAGEWGKTRSDMNFDIIASQSKSLFTWVLARFIVIFLTVSVFSFISMVVVFLVRNEMPLREMILTYFAPAFFLSTVCAMCSFCFSQEHIATLICGIIWLLTMLTKSLLRFSGVEYFYLFIRYAGDQNDIWLINKAVLLGLSLVLWAVIYLLCKKRR